MTIAEQKARLASLLDPDVAVDASAPVRDERPSCMERKLLDVEAEREITGQFSARISDWELDRQNERFAPSDFDAALARLHADGRPIPVLYGHNQTTTSAVLGTVMPADIEVRADGLYASGHIDTATDVGRHIYRMLKRGALQWSIGFSIARSHRASDGTRILDEVGELYELSAVPVPANSRTTTLGIKTHESLPSHTQLHDRLVREGIIARPVEFDQVYREARDGMARLLTTWNGDSVDPEDDDDEQPKAERRKSRPGAARSGTVPEHSRGETRGRGIASGPGTEAIGRGATTEIVGAAVGLGRHTHPQRIKVATFEC